MLERAWALGATNDMWWLDSAAAFAAWDQAIEEAGLSWKYRQVKGGEWNTLERLGDARFRKQGARSRALRPISTRAALIQSRARRATSMRAL